MSKPKVIRNLPSKVKGHPSGKGRSNAEPKPKPPVTVEPVKKKNT